MSFYDDCRKFISIDSTQNQGNRELAECAADLCEKAGLLVTRFYETTGDLEQLNVVARYCDQPLEDELMLQTHLDTADPGPFGIWSETDYNPFNSQIKNDRIYGLGTADTKLDFLCKLEAMKAFSGQKEWRRQPVLVATYGEESGMVGMLKLIRKNVIKAQSALVGEPSDLTLIAAGKGYASVEIAIQRDKANRWKAFDEESEEDLLPTQTKMFFGKAAHSSTPHLGESAIRKMLEYLLTVDDTAEILELDGGINFNSVPSHASVELKMGGDKNDQLLRKIKNIYIEILRLEVEFQKFQDVTFTPPFATLSIGTIRTLPNQIILSGCCRLPPNVTTEVYREWMSQLEACCKKNEAELKILDYKKPYQSDQSSEFFKICKDTLSEMSLASEPSTLPATNEASLLSRVGINCISFGPGKRDGNIHTPTEHVLLEDLNKSIQFYTKVIERYCL